MRRINELAIAAMNFDKEINIGGLIRTANAAGVKEVVIVGRKDWSRAAATKGHGMTLVRNTPTIEEFLEYSATQDYSLVSLENTSTATKIFEYTYPKNPLIIFGNEGRGIPSKILDRSAGIIYIPQFGEVSCLNVVAAGSIAIYDWIRKNAQ